MKTHNVSIILMLTGCGGMDTSTHATWTDPVDAGFVMNTPIDGASNPVDVGFVMNTPVDAGFMDAHTSTPMCLPASTDCTSTPNDCCSGICSIPTSIPGAHAECADPCRNDNDCQSGCCAFLGNTGQKACSARGFCSNTCSPSSGACNNTEDCCVGNTCVTTNGGSCAANCYFNSDCVSNCCAPLYNSTLSVCSAYQFCH